LLRTPRGCAMSFGELGTAQQVSESRRRFLAGVLGSLSAASVSSFAARLPGRLLSPAAKTIVVTFGGGARDEETFAEEGQQNIPHLMKELVPQGTFFTQVVNAGILGHYVATASIVTGVYERFDNFIAQPPPNPTMFEYFRKGLRRPSTDAWVVAPSNGFQRIGGSSHSSFGAAYSANVILPKQLLAAALPGRSSFTGADLAHMLQDNYEMPVYQPTLSLDDRELQLDILASVLRVSTQEFVRRAWDLNSPDELSIFVMQHLMQQLAPSLIMLTLHDMDIAHAGTYSLYVDAIQRADRLCGELWTMIQSMPDYKDRTTLMIMPDFGRDADDDPGGNGFQHHRTGDALARTTWMLALGPHIRQNVTVDRAIQSIDLVPTLGQSLGFATPGARGQCIQELL